MIKKICFMCIFLVCACTTIPIGYLDTLGTAYKSLRNYPGTEIDKDYYDGFQYSFIRAQFSGAPPVILVLSKVENNEFFWVGSDGSTLTTNQDGKIIKTEGINRDIEFISTGKKKYKLNLFNPDAFYQPYESNLNKPSYTNINYLDSEISVMLREEEFYSKIIGWKNKNSYYYFEGRPIRTVQNIHPYLPSLRLDFYYK